MINKNYKGWSWDSNDLSSSKQAFLGLLRDGADFQSLCGLDFGNLDLSACADEL